jgi:tetratricopeptide (TPR) repeat protein
MAFCEQCGAKLPEGAAFCEACGAKAVGAALDGGAAQGGGAKDDRAPVYSKKALAKKPGNQAVEHNNAGTALHKAGQYREAIAEFEQAIALCPHPDEASFWGNAAMAWYELGDYPKALECFRKALEYNPPEQALYRKNVEFLEEAVKKAAKKKAGDQAVQHNNAGAALHKAGQYWEAIAEYEQAIALCPDEAQFWGNAAMTWYELGDYNNALYYCRKALEYNPEEALYRKNLEFLEEAVKKAAKKKPGLFGKGGKG